MQAARVLRVCVVANWILLVAMVVLSFVLESHLPDPLRDWVAAESEKDFTPKELILLGLAVPWFGFYVVGGFGLFLLKRWGAWLFLASLIGLWIPVPFFGPTVEHAVPYALYEASVMITGLIIGLAFFSDALVSEKEEEKMGARVG